MGETIIRSWQDGPPHVDEIEKNQAHLILTQITLVKEQARPNPVQRLLEQV